MTSKPDKRRHLGVMVQNHVFDDAFNPRSPSVSLAEKVHADNGDSLRWTRGYFQEEPWNAPAMKPGDASELLQRYEAQRCKPCADLDVKPFRAILQLL